MNGTQRRETFIALRARRQGYRIASDILNPHLDVPEPLPHDPGEVKRFDAWPDRYELSRPPPPSKLKVAFLVLVDLALVALCLWVAGR